jgi:hypothetical protein
MGGIGLTDSEKPQASFYLFSIRKVVWEHRLLSSVQIQCYGGSCLLIYLLKLVAVPFETAVNYTILATANAMRTVLKFLDATRNQIPVLVLEFADLIIADDIAVLATVATDSDPAAASQKLQTHLLAIQLCLQK